MATTIQDIALFLENQDYKYRLILAEEDQNLNTDRILIGFQTQNYQNIEGENYLQLFLTLEDGSIFKVFAPRCYMLPADASRTLFCKALMMVGWETRFVRFELDDTDGEVRAVIEFPLEDAYMTEGQVIRSLLELVQIVDKFHEDLQRVLKTGEIRFDKHQNEMMSLLEEVFRSHFEENTANAEKMVKNTEIMEEKGIDADSEDSDDDYL